MVRLIIDKGYDIALYASSSFVISYDFRRLAVSVATLFYIISIINYIVAYRVE